MQVVRPGLAGRGVRLSNTLSTYPVEVDNHGKLWLIRHRRGGLERFLAEREAGHAPAFRHRMGLRPISL